VVNFIFCGRNSGQNSLFFDKWGLLGFNASAFTDVIQQTAYFRLARHPRVAATAKQLCGLAEALTDQE
jgi:hypothetical protein